MLHCFVRRHAVLRLSRLHCVRFATSASSPLLGGGTNSGDPHFVVEYLVNSCGFSVEGANKASKPLARLQSTEKPDAVIAFFRSQGIDGANLRKIISYKPRFLCWDVESKLAPKFQCLRDLGLSESDLVDVIMMHPTVIACNVQHTLLPKLNIWESLFGSRELLLKNLRKRGWFFSNSIEKVVRPNLNFLRDECGIPPERASLVIKMHPTFIVQNPDSLRALVDRAEGMGFTRGSQNFLWILDVLLGVSREKVEAHFKLMNSFGWSKSEFCNAIEKQPNFLQASTELLQRKMEFLVKDIGLAPSDIAIRPKILSLGFKTRLIPRFQVMNLLESERLWTSQGKLHMFFSMPHPKFQEKFVLPYKDKIPKLLDIFENCCS
ncbi:transcription termination factor MTERF8, chloroplastic-like [Curcuma longa]|uniref:transcription termination factor MTERF8, chloroplastic-like n=1 Tax=Curcuma longa TaxID=136217 RepID=UPI003D9E9C5F